MRAPRWILPAAVVLFAVIALRDAARLGDQLPWRLMGDFSDFYCAGAALDRGESPYRYEPLHTCEHRLDAAPLIRSNPALVIPAPQPPYDFPPFMLLARLRFPFAVSLYAIAIALAMLVCALAFTRMGIPFDLALVAFAIPAGYQEMAAGQVVPFALLALVLSGAALAAKRDALAGALAALVAIEPQFGAPVALTMLLYVPRARLALLVTALAMGAAGLWTVGLQGFAGYFLSVLPAHAGSELNWPFQYSVTYAAHALGAPNPFAQILGSLSSLAMLAVALWLAPRLAAALRRREMFVFLPALCAVVGGPFIHTVEMPAAVPALLLLAADAAGTLRTVAGGALCLLIVPWIKVWAIKKLFAASLAICGFVLLRLGIAPLPAFGILGALAALIYCIELVPPAPLPVVAQSTPSPGTLASTAWRDFTSRLGVAGLGWFAIKLPTWAALIAALVVAFRTVSLRSRGASAASPESYREIPHPAPASRRARRD